MKIGLALSGGGALGVAHLGAIEELEKAGIKIDYICGVSSGAMIGLAYASGGLDGLHKFYEETIAPFIFRQGSGDWVSLYCPGYSRSTEGAWLGEEFGRQ